MTILQVKQSPWPIVKRKYQMLAKSKMFTGTKRIKKTVNYPLDSSAIIHMTSRCKGYTNCFRLSATLTEKVCPEILQAALNHITPRFPTMIAGIHSKMFQYVIIPAKEPPQVQQDQQCLAYMPKETIKTCGMRVLYFKNKISVEIFHALTDGYGGMIFLNTLIAEYLSLKHNVVCRYTEQLLNPLESPCAEELSDDFLSHAQTQSIFAKNRNVYQLPAVFKQNMPVKHISKSYQAQKLLDVAHHYGVTLTVFLTAVMYAAVLKLQKEQASSQKPVQIMIPINLRNRFASKTLRNYSLYALPYVEASAVDVSIEELIQQITAQIREQTKKEHLSGVISSNLRIQNSILYRILPLPVKNILLHIALHFYGERNSCLSLSNLGKTEYPTEIDHYISDVEFMLSPRRTTACNCSIISHSGRTCIHFTQKGYDTKLEECFFNILQNMMHDNYN